MAKGKVGRPSTKNNIEVAEDNITEEIKTEEVKTSVVEKPKKVIKRQRDLNEMIDVKCIVHGGLNFVTSTGLEVVWSEYGDVYPLEFKELLYMMNKYKRYFEEPWVIMEQDVLVDLHATHFYKNIINYDEIDSIFSKSPEQVKDILNKVPEGTKRLIADRASDALRKGTLDSLKVVEILQKELNIELI